MSVYRKKNRPSKKMGVYILPNLFTTCALFAGFYAIIAAMNHQFSTAAIAINIAVLFDGFDGRIARLINAQSDFGGEYDSLADMVSFGLCPALVFYNWTLTHLQGIGLGKVAWISAFVYTAATALRLAKFNTLTIVPVIKGKHYFFGLPCPIAAALVANLIWVGNDHHLPMSKPWFAISMTVLLISIAVLMLSNIPYRSFKDIDLKNSVRFLAFIVVLLVLMGVAMWPAELLLLIIVSYVLYGPIWALYRWFKKRSRKNKAHKQDE